MVKEEPTTARDRDHGTKVPRGLSEDEIEYLVEKAAERAAELVRASATKDTIESIQTEIGRGLLRFILRAIYLAVLGVLAWLGAHFLAWVGKGVFK